MAPPDFTLTVANQSLTPGSKGERLLPGSKGERLTLGQLRGRVVAATDLLRLQQQAPVPVPAAVIRLEGTIHQATTDSQGFFELQQVPVDTPLTLVAEKANGDGQLFAALIRPQLEQAQASQDLPDIVLAASGNLTGQVSLKAQAEHQGINIFAQGTSFSTKTDLQGHFMLTGLPVGQYRLQMDYPGYQRLSLPLVTISANQTTVTEGHILQQTDSGHFARLKGRVLNQGSALAGVRVHLVGEDFSQNYSATTNTQGEYDIPQITPESFKQGQASLILTRPFFKPIQQKITLPKGQTTNTTHEMAADTLTPGRLQVKVMDCQQQPVRAALIQLNPNPLLESMPFSDNLGQFQTNHLLPGYYTVYAAKGEQLAITGVLVDNQSTGSDGQAGSTIQVKLYLGKSCENFVKFP